MPDLHELVEYENYPLARKEKLWCHGPKFPQAIHRPIALVELFIGSISDFLNQTSIDSVDEPDSTLFIDVKICNLNNPKRSLKHQATIHALKPFQADGTQLFTKYLPAYIDPKSYITIEIRSE